MSLDGGSLHLEDVRFEGNRAESHQVKFMFRPKLFMAHARPLRPAVHYMYLIVSNLCCVLSIVYPTLSSLRAVPTVECFCSALGRVLPPVICTLLCPPSILYLIVSVLRRATSLRRAVGCP